MARSPVVAGGVGVVGVVRVTGLAGMRVAQTSATAVMMKPPPTPPTPPGTISRSTVCVDLVSVAVVSEDDRKGLMFDSAWHIEFADSKLI